MPSPERPVVVVVDDEPSVRAAVKAALAGAYEVLEAADGRAAIETVRSHDADVCLLDVGLSGMEVLERLKTSTPPWKWSSSPPSGPSAPLWKR